MSKPFAAFADPETVRALADRIVQYDSRPLTLMEVCGTHTMSIMKYGIRQVLPPAVRLVAGPGCPVCVTESSYLDMAMTLAERDDVVLVSFGDLLRVPGSRGSLQACRSAGADIRIVYSPLDCLALCAAHPDKQVVFLSVGFETTTPVVALTVTKARQQGITNLSLLTANKTMPAALDALAGDDAVRIDGLIFPGHVCTIAGTASYEAFCTRYRIPGAITGFEPADILGAIAALTAQAARGEARLDNIYPRLVHREGNPQATAIVAEVFTPCSARWRGIGEIEDSGLRLRDAFAEMDAQHRFSLPTPPAREPAGCRCGEILKGTAEPTDCPLYGRACTPTAPVGACMVSSEGACAAFYKYRGIE